MSNYPYRPQQPAWIDARTADTDITVREFMRSVYAWMFGGLAITTGAAFWVLSSPAMKNLVLANRGVFVGLLIAEFALAMWVQVRITRMKASTAASAFLVYSLLNGLTLSAIFFIYTRQDILQAFVSAAGMFGVMSVFGYVTKRSLTSMGSFLIMGFWGIFIGFIVNMWLQSSMMGFILSVIGVFIFLGLTAYYTQQLKSMALSTEHRENFAIVGALVLYISFINLFLMLLRLFGDRR
jgi:uncharacterized protein